MKHGESVHPVVVRRITVTFAYHQHEPKKEAEVDRITRITTGNKYSGAPAQRFLADWPITFHAKIVENGYNGGRGAHFVHQSRNKVELAKIAANLVHVKGSFLE